ncbi:MAG TPA: WD40 repeat domain-containing protein [Aridibacter sp.]|nr:WD40 repeat domain-containing protein [Aridibacter sp.]
MRSLFRTPSWGVVLSIVFALFIAACNAASPVAQSVGTEQIASGHKDGINAIAFSPDARRVATGGNDNAVKLWDTQTGKLEETFEGHTRAISSLAFSPDGKTLASGSFDQTAKLWDVVSGKLKLTISNHPSGQVKGLAFSPDGKTLAGAGDKGVRLWDIGTGNQLPFLSSDRGVLAVAFSPDGKTIAGAGGAGVRLWNAQEGKMLQHLQEAEPELLTSIAFSPDGQTLASGGNRRIVKLWDVKTGKLTGTIDSKGDFIRAMAFSAEGRTLAVADRTSARLWNIETRQVQEVLSSDAHLLSVALSSQGAIWAGGGADGMLKLWRFQL